MVKDRPENTDNVLTLKFDNRSIHSNIKTDNTILKLINKNSLSCMGVRQRQHIQVRHPLNYIKVLIMYYH